MKIAVDLKNPAREPKDIDWNNLGFGMYLTGRMFEVHWNKDKGWYDAKVGPYHNLILDPACQVLHYAQEIFEGMKAYHHEDGEIYCFRPEKNFERLNASARRMCMPEIPVAQQLDALSRLLDAEREWVPKISGHSLYIRPTMIGTEVGLGVRASSEYIYYHILSPVASYFDGGFKPIRLLATKDFVRASEGGVGAAKTGGNYAASLYAGQKAKEMGYDQVIWLDGKEHRYIEESGTMNLFMVIDGKLTTAPLTGTILPGITRDSILTSAVDLGITAEERKVPIEELLEGTQSGRVTEVFAAGTAAVVTAVGEIGFVGNDYKIGSGDAGPITRKIHNLITGIQQGKIEDKYAWMYKIPHYASTAKTNGANS